MLDFPGGIPVDATVRVFLACIENHVICMVALGGSIETLAGTRNRPSYTGDGGTAISG
jgi:hypothetical protein